MGLGDILKNLFGGAKEKAGATAENFADAGRQGERCRRTRHQSMADGK